MPSASEDAAELAYLTEGEEVAEAQAVIDEVIAEFWLIEGKSRLGEGPVVATLRSHPAKPWKNGGILIRAQAKRMQPEAAALTDRNLWVEDEDGTDIPPERVVTINKEAWDDMSDRDERRYWIDVALAEAVEGTSDFRGHVSILRRWGVQHDPALKNMKATLDQGVLPFEQPKPDEGADVSAKLERGEDAAG
jgi:hypothetical protein